MRWLVNTGKCSRFAAPLGLRRFDFFPACIAIDGQPVSAVASPRHPRDNGSLTCPHLPFSRLQERRKELFRLLRQTCVLLKRLATRPVFRQKTLPLPSPPSFRLFFLCLSPPPSLSPEKIGQWFETSKTLSPPPLPDSFTLPLSSSSRVFIRVFLDSGVCPGELAGKIRSVFTQAKGEHAGARDSTKNRRTYYSGYRCIFKPT